MGLLSSPSAYYTLAVGAVGEIVVVVVVVSLIPGALLITAGVFSDYSYYDVDFDSLLDPILQQLVSDQIRRSRRKAMRKIEQYRRRHEEQKSSD
ncbi:hypothetical protein E3N88_44449 [Mikania micrantha]|uniref:Uncharacterized protein n=1 Tax=Mikania micrantha TaxID=192012 RepID=A0A5N6LC04_9ASTR|nr:hypothetical protein E3N88_44449 [Mikania micrantha]